MSSLILKILTGRNFETEGAEVQKEIDEQKAIVRQNTQVLQSGGRVLENMSGMLYLMSLQARASHDKKPDSGL